MRIEVRVRGRRRVDTKELRQPSAGHRAGTGMAAAGGGPGRQRVAATEAGPLGSAEHCGTVPASRVGRGVAAGIGGGCRGAVETVRKRAGRVRGRSRADVAPGRAEERALLSSAGGAEARCCDSARLAVALPDLADPDRLTPVGDRIIECDDGARSACAGSSATTGRAGDFDESPDQSAGSARWSASVASTPSLRHGWAVLGDRRCRRIACRRLATESSSAGRRPPGSPREGDDDRHRHKRILGETSVHRARRRSGGAPKGRRASGLA